MVRKVFYHISCEAENVTRARMSQQLYRAQMSWAFQVLRNCWYHQRDVFVFQRKINQEVRLAMCWVTDLDIFEWDVAGLQGYFNFLFEEKIIS